LEGIEAARADAEVEDVHEAVMEDNGGGRGHGACE
jgi:hypothetical protein